MVDRVALRSAFSRLSSGLSDPGAAARGSAYAGVRQIYERWLDLASRSLQDGQNRRKMTNQAKRAMVEAYGATADLFKPLEPDELSQLNGEVAAELDYIEGWFGDMAAELKDARPTDQSDRVQQYLRSLDAFYNELTVNQSSTDAQVYWRQGATEKGCPDCTRLDGQLHKISYYVNRNFIPRKPGASMKCGGYRCDCDWIDKMGNVVGYDG